MIYLRLFLSFLMVGAVSFGGGYGMISLVREIVLTNGWLTEEAFLDFIAVSESTPGPLAVNMATFVGASQGGFFGALLATLGVVLPAFFIILLIAALLKNLLKYAGVGAFLGGVRPAVVGMILATALGMALSCLFGVSVIGDPMLPDGRAMLLLFLLVAVHLLHRKIRGRSPSPILMILLSALLGVLFYAPFAA